MRPMGLSRIAACAALMLLAPLARAQDAPPSDDVVMLPCDGRCPAITPPVPLERHPAHFEPRFFHGVYVEAFVDLQYTVGADGKVSDVHVKKLLGSKEFSDLAVHSLDSWRYKPATLDGEAVAVSHELHYYFNVTGTGQGARPAVVRAYEQAVALNKDGKQDEAFKLLQATAAQTELNFYERGMIAGMLAPLLEFRGSQVEAREVAGIALDAGARTLPPAVVRNLYHSKIRSSLALGDIVDAAKSLGRLTRVPGFDPADPIVQAVKDMRTKVSAVPSYVAVGRIPASSEADGYFFWLYRRYFSFTNVVGKLDRVTVNCDQKQVESPIKDKVDWHVPKEWSDCSLFIRGTPGTTFNILQMKPDNPATP